MGRIMGKIVGKRREKSKLNTEFNLQIPNISYNAGVPIVPMPTIALDLQQAGLGNPNLNATGLPPGNNAPPVKAKESPAQSYNKLTSCVQIVSTLSTFGPSMGLRADLRLLKSSTTTATT
uniref:Uncharacterized protein n=1 Tax=Romanomermis culicivorax TaxID=13658 RepID=A0A915IYJ0_ROMCU